jgi:hypothetical protein
MTHEGQDTSPEETPPPPTSTRSPAPETDDDVELMPPFVPGRSRPAPEGEPVLATDEAVLDTAEGVRDVSDTAPEAAEAGGALTPEEEEGEGEEAADEEEPFPFEFPIEEEHSRLQGEGMGQANDDAPSLEIAALESLPTFEHEDEPEPSGSFEMLEPEALWAPVQPDEVEERAEVEEPTDVEEVEEVESVAEVEEPAEVAAGAPAPTRADVAAAEVADRLEALAGRIRAEGQNGAELEMASLDRLTSLVAALIAGYLAGIRD